MLISKLILTNVIIHIPSICLY